MNLKSVMGSLVLASLLSTGAAFAQNIEPVPEHNTGDLPNKEGELARIPLSKVLRDAPREDIEQAPVEGFLPELPILVDGVRYTAQQLQERDIHLSHYVLDGNSAAMAVVQGFRTTADLTKYFQQTHQFPSEQPTTGMAPCNPWSVFFEHSWYGGAAFSVYPGWGYNTLGWWNDRISSMWSTQCGRWTLMTEHSYFGGHVLWVGRAWAIGNMGSYGWYTGFWPFRRWHSWNDRVSSVAVYW
ncbi:hypothetical protein VZQ01_03940 [Myxococcus faecalis]|jgi:hypothetical protein|uniref:hypothetical protein n=2 Tax=Myxococcaceae TaxID=31 RepID=UPI001CBDE108|nr:MULTISPECIES: hypothetical protein [unclassified Myxococcus]MBZ4396999.1 hypothetical protein [Myxococcus sp. AS-1-15]MBZ4408275.1 hypothetical protein [Myxococcus sp. XM-1-1-1]BDT33373.1 hypothetical protein MFMH1_30420 [Myxococcus sp. MH1]